MTLALDRDLAVTLTRSELRSLVAVAVAEALEGRGSVSAPSEVMTRAEAAEFLRCSLGQLDRLAREGGLPFHRLGDSRRFLRSELIAWLTREGELNG